MSVKSIILGSASVAALVLASNASAADVPHHHVSSIVVSRKAPSFSWEGLYAGAQVGYSASSLHYTGKDDKETKNSDLENTFGKPSGINGGLYAGYNIDLGSNLVAGLDADINLSRLKKSVEGSVGGPEGKKDITNLFKEKYNGAVRARLGYNLGRALPYIAGGLSYASLESATELKDGKFPNGKTPKYKVASGWNLGAGVDYLLADNLVLRADYRFQDIKEPALSHAEADKVVTKDQKDTSLRSNNFRVGVAYKF